MNAIRGARAFAFGAPLAVLAAVLVGPPDPLGQVVAFAGGVLLFVSVSYHTVAQDVRARTLAAFYATVLVVSLAGSVVASAVGGVAPRFLVLLAAVAAGAVVADRVR